MDISGDFQISAPRERVWDALNDAEILRQCIPGCQAIAWRSENELAATLLTKVGPVKANFTTVFSLTDLRPPASCRISGKARGGAAGFAHGHADVVLEGVEGATVLRYVARMQVGGKLAQVGSRLLDGTARKLAGEFFTRFATLLDPGTVPDSPPMEQPAIGSFTVSLTLNGSAVTVDVAPRTLLVSLLREQLRLTGTHVGCDTSQCGACVVHVDGKSVKSCTMLAVQADGAAVTTIEALAEDGRLHPMQEAFREHHALQCGFCTPGMVMSALDLVARNPDPSEGEIREWLEGNLCRCTGYHNIVKAIAAGAQAMRR